MPQMLADDEIEESINFLNSKPREVFNMVHKCDKDYIKHIEHNIEVVYDFVAS